MVSPSGEQRLLDVAAIFAAVFIVIGVTFARKPWPSVDRFGSLASGKALPLAIVFTRSGYTPALTVVAIAGAIAAIALRASLGAPAMLIALQLVGQLCA